MLIPYVSLQQIDELLCLKVNHPKAEALIALQGAQLLNYTPTGGQPVIWLSETAEFKKGQSVRGGIPICWPWFGDARKNPTAVQEHLPKGPLPAHGWVRSTPWLLEYADGNNDAVLLRFRYPSTHWPAPFPDGIGLSVEMRIGSELSIDLITQNQSGQTLCFSQALHSYFAVSDISEVKIKGLENITYIDTLDDWTEKSSDTAITVEGETDRIYLNTPERITIEDEGWSRKLGIESQTSRSAVVWNPWIEKGKRLSQFAEAAYRGMICVETASASTHCLTLATLERGVINTHIKI